MKSKQLIIIVMVICMVLGISGCSRGKQPAKPLPQTSSQKSPKELQKMKDDLAKLGQMLEKRKTPAVKISTPISSSTSQKTGGAQDQKTGSSSQGDQKQEQSQSQSNQGQSQPGQNTGQQGSQQSQMTPQMLVRQQQLAALQEWKNELKLVRSLHQCWNVIEAQASAKGLTDTVRIGMENNLDKLAQAVTGRDTLQAQLAANQVFRYYADVYQLFQPGIVAELNRLRFHVAEARLQAEQGKWTAAYKEASEAGSIWRTIGYSIDGAKKEQLSQMEHSLTDLSNAVISRSVMVTSIKTEIALKNLDKLEKLEQDNMKKASLSGSSGGQ